MEGTDKVTELYEALNELQGRQIGCVRESIEGCVGNPQKVHFLLLTTDGEPALDFRSSDGGETYAITVKKDTFTETDAPETETETAGTATTETKDTEPGADKEEADLSGLSWS